MMDDRLERAKTLYEQSVFGGDASALVAADRELDGVEADLALARGRVIHARFLEERAADPQELVLFERAAQLYNELDDVRGESEAVFLIAIYHQVVLGDSDTALPLLERARNLALQAGDQLTLSYVVRHLAFVDADAGRFEAARGLMEESTRLRREVNFPPGVAMNLLGLAYISRDQGREDDIEPFLDEAQSIAEASEAAGVLRHIDDARKDLLP